MTDAVGMSLPEGRPLDDLRIVSPGGVRFEDFTTGMPVTAGLEVLALPMQGRHAPRPALRSPTGIYTFHGLPGLRAFELRQAGVPLPEHIIEGQEFLILVRDALGRYLPHGFRLALPIDPEPLSPGVAAVFDRRVIRAYLFSAPTRRGVAGLGVVRADLRDAATGRAAAHALVRLSVAGGFEYYGIADARGQVAVMFPLPEQERLVLGSPPGSPGGPPVTQKWDVSVSVFHESTLDPATTASGFDPPVPWKGLPTLGSILALEASSPWQVILEDGADPVAEWVGELTFRQELILRTEPRFWLEIIR